MNIRHQIIAILIVTLIICLGIGFFSVQNEREFISTKTIEFQKKQLNSVSYFSSQLKNEVTKLQAVLANLSQMPKLQFLNKNESLLHMIRAYKLNKNLVTGIFRVDSKNNLYASYPASAKILPKHALDALFNKSRMTGKPGVKIFPQIDPSNDFMVIAVPVYTIQGTPKLHPNNKFSGLLYFTVSISNLYNRVYNPNAFGQNSLLWTMDKNHHLLWISSKENNSDVIDGIIPNQFNDLDRENLEKVLSEISSGKSGNIIYKHQYHESSGTSSSELMDSQQNFYLSPINRFHSFTTNYISYTSTSIYGQTWYTAVINGQDDITLLIDKSIYNRLINTLALLATFIGMISILLFIIKRNHKLQLEEINKRQSALIQSEKMASLGILSAGIAHELNNPLSFVKTNLHMVNDYHKLFTELIGVCNEYHDHPQLPAQLKNRLQELENKDLSYIKNDLTP
ncbi:histidine kinase dimerization/phospho-acceptor domain-containing protein [Dongshaea marina]|uniref:histidine kinase dimerization/phospho-acceptor domain-containing protein n=1 Tax=Dongshaea marina TaxID=2047966 RepID=UPI000D3E0C46|nr:histidine kinase dimerization/phospho-acceptor domain-containing protein [Dongshaea marina]